MVPSVVPIVIGYAIAHYATLLIVEGQRTAINWSDPLGRGWNVFGSAEMGVNAAIFDYPTVIALIQLTAIVGGHILGIVCAHELAVRLLPTGASPGRAAADAAGDGRLHLRRAGAAVLAVVHLGRPAGVHDVPQLFVAPLKRAAMVSTTPTRPRTGTWRTPTWTPSRPAGGRLSWISAKALIDSVNHGLDRFSDGLVPQLRPHWVATTPAPDLRIIERPDVTTLHDHRRHRGAGRLAVRGLPLAERRGARRTGPVS